MKTELIAVVLALAVTAGCGGPAGTPERMTDTSINSGGHHSGFLSDYSKLRPLPGHEGTLLYVDHSVNLRPYARIVVDPLQIFLTENLDYRGVQPEVLQRMTDTFRTGFQKAMQPDYQLVDAGGPGVLRIRLAITNVHPTQLPLKPSDFIPIKAVINAGRAAAGASPRIIELSAEMEVLDPNGRVVLAGVSTRKGDHTLAQGDTITWAELRPILESWAGNFRQRLNEARGIRSR